MLPFFFNFTEDGDTFDGPKDIRKLKKFGNHSSSISF